MREEHETVLDYWFGDLKGPFDKGERSKIWFGGGEEIDREIAARFGELHARACAGELDHWRDNPRSLLALVILFDQFSRNIHRKQPEAFAQDERALQLTLHALDQGMDPSLRFIERVFLYMPMMHSESVEVHQRGQAVFDALVAACPEAHREAYADYPRYMRRHADIVARFGRYPHRNEILGRTTTDEERAFLKEPGSSFG
jgi:uncharacterized protein (DUF924 family)